MPPVKLEPRVEILLSSQEQVQNHLHKHRSLKNCVLRDIDLRDLNITWQTVTIENTTFLGCLMSLASEQLLRKAGAFIISRPDNLPYNPFRKSVYTWQELLAPLAQGENEKSLDWQIYHHFSATRYNPPISEALFQRIHDHAIDDDLRNLLRIRAGFEGMAKCVGFMGGHSALRSGLFYRKTAQAAKLLAEHGYFIVSGGGPGIMEACNLGAYLAGQSSTALEKCLERLSAAPHYEDSGYQQAALDIIEAYPEGNPNLAIPTWFYGHEPSNLFATHIAKYFSNSIREENLLAICLYGVVFAPGSAGTTQEIFLDAAQNHYGTFSYYSPMVFLGRQRYEEETMIYPLLRQLAKGRKYADMLFLTDEPEEVLHFIQAHPPVRA